MHVRGVALHVFEFALYVLVRVVVNDKYDMFKGLALFLFFCFSDPRLHVSHFESPVMLS